MSRIRLSIAFRPRLASEGYLRSGGTIPLLEKNHAAPLEFIRSPVHLLGKHSPTEARLRRTARRPDRAVDLLASFGGFEDFVNSPMRHLALLGGYDAVLSCICRWATRPRHWCG